VLRVHFLFLETEHHGGLYAGKGCQDFVGQDVMTAHHKSGAGGVHVGNRRLDTGHVS